MKMSKNYYRLLEAALGQGNHEITGAELSRLTGIGRGTIYVHLGRLVDHGWMEVNERTEKNGIKRGFYRVTGLGERAMSFEKTRRSYEAAGKIPGLLGGV